MYSRLVDSASNLVCQTCLELQSLEVEGVCLLQLPHPNILILFWRSMRNTLNAKYLSGLCGSQVLLSPKTQYDDAVEETGIGA